MQMFVEGIADIEPVNLVIFDQETRKWGRSGGVWNKNEGA